MYLDIKVLNIFSGVEVQDVEKQEVVSNFGSEAPAEEKDPSVDGEIPIIIMSKEVRFPHCVITEFNSLFWRWFL